MKRGRPSQLEVIGLQSAIPGFRLALKTLQDQLRQMEAAVQHISSPIEEYESFPLEATHLTPEGRQAISDASKKRWATVKKAKRGRPRKDASIQANGHAPLEKNERADWKQHLSETTTAYWASMSPQKRHAVLKQRAKVRANNKALKEAAARENDKVNHVDNSPTV